MNCLNPKCGRELVRHQYGAESEEAFLARVESGYCRSKCRRLCATPKPPRPHSTLSLQSCNTGRAEMVAVGKAKIPRDRTFLLFVITGECELRGGKFGPCSGDRVYHHTEGGGVALKGSDYSAICACYGHHELFDNATKKGIGIFTEQELKLVVARNQMEYVEAGHKIKKG